MRNIEKYNKIFMDIFEVKEEQLDEKLEYQSILEWDSVGHMSLVAEIEEVFGIMLETDDIIDFSSYEKGKEILGKLGVTF